MTVNEITKTLLSMRDAQYAAFQAKLLPNISPDAVIGVRTPMLRKFAKALAKKPDANAFLSALPHIYFEENQLHAFLISEEKDFGKCMELTERFLPMIDNWATCDQFSPKVFGKDPEKLLPSIHTWLLSAHTYTVRYAVGMLMRYFLDDRFLPEYPALVAAIRSDAYYINMMQAWYFATALAKQYDAVISYIDERKLPETVHNMTVQKCIESYRITDAQKQHLRTCKIRKKV